MPRTGAYQLHIEIGRDTRITIGKLGRFPFPKGLYIYTGSSMTNLDKRIARHQKKTGKKIHWHIDHLLAHPATRIIKIETFESPKKEECTHNHRIAETPGATTPAPRFGSTDCTAACPAHLFRIRNP